MRKQRRPAQTPAHIRPVRHHLEKLDELHDDVERQSHALALAGNVTTEKKSTIGIGVLFQIVFEHKNQSYRAREALSLGIDDGALADAEWIDVKANTTLRALLAKHGADLLAFEADRQTVSIEAMSFEVFEKNTRCVRILLRRHN